MKEENKNIRRLIRSHKLSTTLTKMLFELLPKKRGLSKAANEDDILSVRISHRVGAVI
jgi:hypothetical protein